MKKIMYLATMFVVVAMFASYDKEEIITESQLPSASREFLKTHFDGVSITRIIQENEMFDKEYTVYLANGFKVDFEKSGAWDEINGFVNPLPQNILDLFPAGIVQYVNTTFPNSKIVKANKERFGYEIELNSGIELEFNSNGEFLRMD